MKKYLILIISIFFITGCRTNSKTTIYSDIKQNGDGVISITYPKTNIKKLDNYIKKDINKTTNKFYKINYEEKELNIDYTYNNIDNNYINISIKTYMSYDNYQIEDIYTYVFDKEKNKLLDITDIINTSNDLQDITNKFIFDEDFITFFYTQNNKIEQKKIKLDNININIEKVITDTETNYESVNKIIDIDKPVVALTFDDGPSEYTKEIIDLLNFYDCNATFFVLGNKVNFYKETIKYAINSGNEIGNHSYNHKWLSRLESDEIKEQINKTQDILKQELNYTPILLRPTYGSVNKKIRNSTDLEIVLWSVDTLDWKIKSSKKIADKALSKIKDGSIILMHDTHKRTYEALKIMIPKLLNQGYQFVTVSELNKIKELKNNES